MTIDRIRTNLTEPAAQNLHRTVPVQPVPQHSTVDIPGVLDQTRRLYQPYRGHDNKDTK